MNFIQISHVNLVGFKMKILKYLFYFLFFWSYAESTDFCVDAFESKNPNMHIQVEYCAEIIDSNSYRLKVIKPKSLSIDSKWEIPDSINVSCTGWNYSNHILTPRNCGTLVAGGIAKMCIIQGNKNNKKSKVPSLSINLEERDKERGLYTLSNASQTLKKYYNHFFEAEWNARLINSGVILSIKYEAFLIGECPDSLTMH